MDYQEGVKIMIDYKKLNPEQYEAVMSNSVRILALSGAGTGKTQVLTHRIARLLESGINPNKLLSLTFTRAAGAEMKERVIGLIGEDGKSLFCNTFHAFAVDVIRTYAEALGYEENFSIYEQSECNEIMQNVLQSLKLKIPLTRIADFRAGKAEKIERMTPSDIGQVKRAIAEYEYRLRRNNAFDFDGLINTLKKAVFENTDICNAIKKQYTHIFVDEFQDTDAEQWSIVQGIAPNNLFVVGDDYQCQPAGTKVTMMGGHTKNIETVMQGEQVLSYNMKYGYFPTSPSHMKKVLSVSKHHTNELIEIKTLSGHTSRYTKNHKCYARFHWEGNQDKHVVYIMRNAKGWYRVGTTGMFMNNRSNNFGVRMRMHQEGGIEAWIVDICNTACEAWMLEQRCSYEFGIPQTTWINTTHVTDDDLAALYEKLGDLTQKVATCLLVFGRDINYPVFTKSDNIHYSRKHLAEIRACNLFPKCMDIGIPTMGAGASHTKWGIEYSQIIEVNTIESQDGYEVYGLDVEDNHNYVADGILTHNSIYAFRGSNIKIILNLAKNPLWYVVKLEQNYRSTLPIVTAANALIKHNHQTEKQLITDKQGVNIVYRQPSNDEAEITDIISQLETKNRRCNDSTNNNYYTYKTTAILARTNRQLERVKAIFKSKNIPFETLSSADSPLTSPGAKDIFIWISAIINPNDDVAMRKALLGKASRKVLLDAEWLQITNNVNLIEALKETEGSEHFISIYENVKERFYADDNISAAVNRLVLSLGLRDSNGASAAKYEISNWHQRQLDLGEPATASDLLKWVNMCNVAEKPVKERDASKIQLMTVHGSKGLEFDEVYIIGATQDIFPNRGDLEEERRLFYVAMTRAREYLNISSPRTMPNWNGNTLSTLPSQFIAEAGLNYQ